MEASADAGIGSIVLYGATGYTGKLVARELDRRGFDFILSGRNDEKLRSVALLAEQSYCASGALSAASAFDPRKFLDLLKFTGLTYKVTG